MKGNKKISEFKKFIKQLNGKNRVAIIYDSDPDGLTAAVITSKAVERIRGKKPELVFFQAHATVSLQDNSIQKLKKNKINRLIILDLAVDQDAKQIKKAEKICKILVLDHHKSYQSISSKKTTLIKASSLSFMEPSKYATSKMAFDLFSEVTNISDLKWLACIGLMGDYCVKAWKKFFDQAFFENNTSEKEICELMEIISSTETVNRNKVAVLFKEFFKAKKPQDIHKTKYSYYKKLIKKELKRLELEFHKKKEVFPKQELVCFHFKSKLDIKSILVNKISTTYYPDKTVVILEEKEKKIMTISARRQDYQVKMNDVLEKAVKGLKGAMAGGHIPAAGGKIDKKDMPKFKQNLLKVLSTS